MRKKMRTRIMRVPVEFHDEIFSLAKETKLDATRLLKKNVGLFRKSYNMTKFFR